MPAARLVPPELLDFLLFDWLDLGAAFDRAEFCEHDRASVTGFLDLAEKLAHDSFLNHYRAADAEEPRLNRTANGEASVQVHPAIAPALKAFTEAGFMAAPFKPEIGGHGLPEQAQMAAMAQFMAANIATSGYAMLTIANARLLARYGSETQIEAFALPQLNGAALGTMCLSEPQAGSSLADIRCRAVPDGAGSQLDSLGRRYRISGNKMWISGGDQDIGGNIHHLVLAKIPDASGNLPEGTAGLSLFLVPKLLPGSGARNDVVVAGLNHKMGYRGTSNCLLNFGEAAFRPEGAPGAIGWLIGSAGQGLAIMFHMMNEARINVALGAAALALRSHALSKTYAEERLQGRAGGPSTPPVPIARHPDVARQLLRQQAYAEGGLSFILFCASLVDDAASAPDPAARSAASELLGLLTPAAKTWVSEWGCEACSIGIQIHGGYGYARDFDLEQLYRDNRLNPIHEGTTGIQGLDFVGRKLLRERGAGLGELGRRIGSSLTRAELAGLGTEAGLLRRRWERFRGLPARLAEQEREQWMAGATELLDGFGHLVVGWLLLDQALTQSARAPERLKLARFFLASELPRADRCFDLAETPPPLVWSGD